jgi:hypothetical protein
MRCFRFLEAFLATFFGLLPMTALAALDLPTTQPATQPAAEVASVELLSLQIARPLSPEIQRMSGVYRRMGYVAAPNGAPTGVDMLIAVHVPQVTILSAGEDALHVTTFIDDKFNELGYGRHREGVYYNPSGPFANVTEDHHSCVFRLSAEQAPTGDASRILVRGTITLRISRGQKTSEHQKLPLRIGKKLAITPVPFTLRQLSQFNNGLRISLSADGSIERISSLRFFSNDGQELTVQQVARNDSGLRGSQSTLEYQLPEGLDEVLVEANYAQTIENLVLPLEVTADIGVASLGHPATAPAEERSSDRVRSGIDRRTLPRHSGFASSNAQIPAGTAAAEAIRADQPLAGWPPRERIPFPATRPALNPAVVFPSTRPAFPQPPSFAATQPATQPADTDVAVKVISVGICKTPPNQGAEHFLLRPALLFHERGGTVLRLMLSSPSHTFVDVDSENVNVTRFVDDTGAELSTMKMPRIPFMAGAVSNPYNISRDGHAAMVQVAMTDSPSTDATRLALLGAVGVQLGSQQHSVELKNVSLEVGSTFKVGPMTLTLKAVSTRDLNYNGVTDLPGPTSPVVLDVSSTESADLIRGIDIVDSQGQSVSCTVSHPRVYVGSSAFTLPHNDFQCFLAHDVGKVTMNVTYFDRVESVQVPIQIITGIGL